MAMAFLKQLKRFFGGKEPIRYEKPPSLNDSVASVTSWLPLRTGGANFRNRVIAHEDRRRIVISASLWANLFNWLFVAMGAIAIAVGIFSPIRFAGLATDPVSVGSAVIQVLVGAGFVVGGSLVVITGYLSLLGSRRSLKFDHSTGSCERDALQENALVRLVPGWARPVFNLQAKDAKLPLLLSHIHAVQIIPELIRGRREAAYFSYELNLVLKDAERVNVMDHGDRKRIETDARTIAKFLNVPLWELEGR